MFNITDRHGKVHARPCAFIQLDGQFNYGHGTFAGITKVIPIRPKVRRTVHFTNCEMDGRDAGTHFFANGPWDHEFGIQTGTWWLYPNGKLVLS